MLDSRTTRLRLALFGGAALLSFPATIGGQAFGQADAAPIAPGPILITLTDAGCDPAKVDVTAGKTTFNIKNESTRAVEWEILKDVMVVDERENILPGFAQTLTDDSRRRRLRNDLRAQKQPQGHSDGRGDQRRAGEAVADGPGRPDRGIQSLRQRRGRRPRQRDAEADGRGQGRQAGGGPEGLRAGPSAL